MPDPRSAVPGEHEPRPDQPGGSRPSSNLHSTLRLREHLRERWAVRASLRREAEPLLTRRAARWARLPLRIEPAAAPIPHSPPVSNGSHAGEDDLARSRTERVGVVRRILGRLVAGESVGAGALNELVYELIDEGRRRERLLPLLALGTGVRADSLAEHCFCVGVLSVGIALRLGWSHAHVRAAGLAGLLADAGIALLPMPVRTLDRALTDIELNAVRRHTLYSAALLERVAASSPRETIPEMVSLGIYQHHEREDGSGYPQGLRGPAIHDLAKVIAVADVFAGAIAPRAHRPPTPAPGAIAAVAREATAGILDRRATMALIELCGVYPPGSRLRLNTGQDVVVLYTGRSTRLDRPVVRPLEAGDTGPEGDTNPLDLAGRHAAEIRILSSLAA